jgi:PAS domain S-box-containing protein
MWSQNSIDWKRRLTQAGVVAAAYYLTGRLAVSLAIPPGVATVVWPPSGVALTAVLLWGGQVWPGIWLGSVLINIGTLYDASSIASAARAILVVGTIGIGSTLQPLLGAFLIRRFIGSTNLLDGPRDAFAFVGIEAISCVVASLIGTTSLCLGAFAPWWAYRHTWFTWWMGDLVGIIVITPLALAWRTWTLKGLRPQHAIEALALAVLMVGVGRFALWGSLSSENGIYSMKFVLVPFVVWAAFRFGQKAVTLVILLASGMAIGGAIHVARQLTWLSSQDSLLITQVFVGVMSVTGLALTSTLEERRRAVQALRNAHDELDLRVQKRTADLTDANELLRTAIVERQRREEALEESEARFRAVIESASEAVVQADGQGNIIGWNPAAQAIFGYESEDVIGLPLTQLMAARYRVEHQQGLVRFRTTGEPYLTGKTTELEGLRKDGSEFPIEISISHWTQGDEDFFGAIIRDITRRRKAEEALRDSEEMLRGLFEFAPDTVIVVDNRGCILRVNRQVEGAFGYRREELLGQQVEMLLPERLRGQHVQQRDDYIDAPRLRPMGAGLELFGRRKDGSEFPVDIMLSPLALDHGHMVIAVVRDISRRKHAQDELMRSEKQLRALAGRLQSVREEERAGTARELHDELGHALTGLKMDVAAAQKQLAKAGDDPRPVFRERLEAMSGLIDGMIKSVRKISSDLRPGLLDDVGLVAAIEWQANDFQNRSGIVCGLSSLPDEISLSRDATTAVFRIFQEALTNVARHAKASHVEVAMVKQDEYLILQVSDNGRGISGAELSDKASLGLLGMQERAAMLGGEVRITGAKGKGTTVQVKIPRTEVGTRANPDR